MYFIDILRYLIIFEWKIKIFTSLIIKVDLMKNSSHLILKMEFGTNNR